MTEAKELTPEELKEQAKGLLNEYDRQKAEELAGTSSGRVRMSTESLHKETGGGGGDRSSAPPGETGDSFASSSARLPGGEIDENGRISRLPSLGPSYFLNIFCRWCGRVTGEKTDISLTADECNDLDLGWEIIREKHKTSTFQYAPEAAFIFLLLAILLGRFWPQVWAMFERLTSNEKNPGNHGGTVDGENLPGKAFAKGTEISI